VFLHLGFDFFPFGLTPTMLRTMINKNGLGCWVLLVAFLLYSVHCPAQQEGRPYNIKVLSDHKDKDGNEVRTIQYEQGGKRMIETETIPSSLGLRVPVNPDTINKDSVLVVVNKSKFKLEVYYRKRLIRSYKAVFGPKPLENKRMAGDRCTPEGWFTIKNKNPQSKYDKFMLLSYPTDSSIARFNRLKLANLLPRSAEIGGDVGIHGIWKGGDDMIEMGVCWTDGCVAIKNKDIDDLYTLVGIGTRVYIIK
jgi:murein L,D-transpeptidase YafK